MPRPLTLCLFSLALSYLPAPAAPTEEQRAAAAVQAPLPPPAVPTGAAASSGTATEKGLAPPVAPPAPGQLRASPIPRQPPTVPSAATNLPPATPSAPSGGPPVAGSTPAGRALPAPAPPSGLPGGGTGGAQSRIPDIPQPAATAAPRISPNTGLPKPSSSTSSTGQFIVHGPDLSLRSAFSGRCDEVAAALGELLHDKEAWALPIVVLIKTGDAAKIPGPAVTTTISQIAHGGFHLQVTVQVRPDLRPAEFRAELVRVLLAERILRHQTALASERKRLLPDWVFEGVLEAMDYRQRARPSALFAAIFKSGKIYGIEEIIEASADAIEDGLSRTIYQTSCCALVLALLEQPDGGLRMAKFLNALASDKRAERELLNQWFPSFAATPASLNKWWSLQMANLAAPTMREPLSAADTARLLEEALTLRFRAKAAEVPRSRPVVATVPPKPAASAPAGSVSAPTAPVAPAAPTEAEKPTDTVLAEPPSGADKPSFFSRMNPFRKRARSDDEVIADAAAEAALAEAPAAESAPAETEEAAPAGPRGPVFANRKPLLQGMFASEEEPASTLEAPATEVRPERKAKKSLPESEPTLETPASDSKKVDRPSIFNPLNWFRGKKPAKPEGAAGEPQASLRQVIQSALWARSPLAGDLFAEWAPALKAPESRVVEGFLGIRFGKKKKEGEEAKKDDPARATATADEKKSTPPAMKGTAPTQQKKAPAEKAPEPAPSAMPAPVSDGTAETVPQPAAEISAPVPGPIKIKPLFGGGSKTDEAEPAAPSPSPAAASGEPKPQAEEPSAPPPRRRPATSKAAPARPDETEVDAALPLEDYKLVMKRKDRAEILKRNLSALAILQNRSAVLFRPIVNDYNALVAELMEGRTDKVDARLRELRTRTAEAVAKSKTVRDFVDVYEANESPVFSGYFDDYLKLQETIRNELTPRNDPIALYLDALDREFTGGN